MVCVMLIDEEGGVRFCSQPLEWAKAEGGSVRVPGGEIAPGEGLRVDIVDVEQAVAPVARETRYALVNESIPGGARIRPMEIKSSLEE